MSNWTVITYGEQCNSYSIIKERRKLFARCIENLAEVVNSKLQFPPEKKILIGRENELGNFEIVSPNELVRNVGPVAEFAFGAILDVEDDPVYVVVGLAQSSGPMWFYTIDGDVRRNYSKSDNYDWQFAEDFSKALRTRISALS